MTPREPQAAGDRRVWVTEIWCPPADDGRQALHSPMPVEAGPGSQAQADPKRRAEAAYAEMLAGPEWSADVRPSQGQGDPELEAAEAEPEAGL